MKGSTTTSGLAVAGGLAALAVLLAGCEAGPANDGTVELRYYDYQLNEPEHGPALEALIDQIEEEHPNIRVTVEAPPYAEYEAKLIAQGRAGQGPDVAKVLDGGFVNVSSAGLLLDLSPYVEQAGGDTFLEPFYSDVADLGLVGDQRYGIPAWFGPYVLQYNAEAFESYGIDPETDLRDWDSFLAAVKKVKAESGGSVSGYTVQGLKGETTVQRLLTWLFNNGATVLDDDGAAAFNSSEGKEAFRFWAELAAAGGPSPATQGPQEVRAAFAGGDTLGIQSFVWAIPIVEGLDPAIVGKSAIAPMPSPDGQPSASNMLGGLLTIGKDTEHPEEAWELVQWLSSKQAAEKIWLDASMFPARTDVTDNAEIADDPLYQGTAAAAESLQTFPHIPEWPQIAGFLADAMQEVLVNGADPDDALDAAAEKTNQLLGKG